MFRERLKQLRKRKGLSQQQLAEQIHVAQSTVGNWEAGSREPDFATTAKLAAFFGVSTDYLLGETDHYVHPDYPNLDVYPKESSEVITFQKGQKKEAPPPSDMDEREALRDALIKAGIIPADRDLTPEEAKVLFGAAKGVFESFDK